MEVLSKTATLAKNSSLKNALRQFSSATHKKGCESGLHKIQTDHTNPMKLFEEWYQTYLNDNPKEPSFKVCCVSTATKNGDVSSRNLLLRRLDDDGFVIMTDNRSYKSKNLAENPQASGLFLWNKYVSKKLLTRQVRIHGSVVQLPNQDADQLFHTEPIFAKIRAHICHQGQPVQWDLLKSNHDELLIRTEKVNTELKKLDHVVSYKILPKYLEFYESYGKVIADRLLYTKSDSTWKISRIAA